MKTLTITGILLASLAGNSPLFAQTSSDEVAQLKERVAHLEKQVQEMSRFLQPMIAQQAAENRRRALREGFEKKMAQDQAKYSQEQLREAEQLYQVANQKWGSTEALESLQVMIRKYPEINRTGCAVLYAAQHSQGETRIGYLKECIQKHNDCFYGDGVQVGPFARLLLAAEYSAKGERDKAAELYKELQTKFINAIDHSGNPLVESVKVEAK